VLTRWVSNVFRPLVRGRKISQRNVFYLLPPAKERVLACGSQLNLSTNSGTLAISHKFSCNGLAMLHK
jgi:hypothetical protein